MIGPYKKSPLLFAAVWIAAYIFLITLTDTFSARMGFRQVLTLPALFVVTLIILGFIRKNGLWAHFGLCRNRGVSYGRYLWFIPFAAIASSNLWNGVRINGSAGRTLVIIFTMLLVGFIEEVLFRGFLFQAIARKSLKAAVAVSSLGFGFGHIINLLTRADLLDTSLQIIYATSVGLLFAVFLVKSGSLWPCIVVHGVLNALNAFAVPGDEARQVAQAVILTVIALGYAAYIAVCVPAGQKMTAG